MSDDIKKIYRAYAETIEPSEAYRAKLIQRMDAAQKPKKSMAFSYGILAACAVLVFLSVYENRQRSQNGQPESVWEMVSYGRNLSRAKIQKFSKMEAEEEDFLDLSDAQWISGALAGRIKDSLLVLEYDSYADFSHSKLADADMVEELCREIATSKDINMTQDVLPADAEYVYYRALFCDGSVTTFFIVDGSKLVIGDEDTVYQMKQ